MTGPGLGVSNPAIPNTQTKDFEANPPPKRLDNRMTRFGSPHQSTGRDWEGRVGKISLETSVQQGVTRHEVEKITFFLDDDSVVLKTYSKQPG